MVVSFAVKLFCGEFLHGKKKVAWVIRKKEDLFFWMVL